MRHTVANGRETRRADGSTARTARRATRWPWMLAMPAAMAFSLVVPPAAAHAVANDVTSIEVSFVGNGGVVLRGTILTPVSSTQRRPAMVMVQGAGNRGRQELRADAEAFARRGIVTLIYDKRTVGYSLLHRDYSVLADDALAGLRLLRSRPDVEPAQLGIWAASEGAFVAPLAAARSAEVKFLVTVGAVGVTPAAQTAWQWGEYLRHAGVSGSLSHTMRVTAVPMTIGAGLFPEADFDPAPAWEGVHQPVLAQWGELDHDAVPGASSRIIRQSLDRGGNTHYTIRFVPAVRHSLHRTANGGFDHLRSLPSDYGDYEAAWIDRLAHTLPEASADPAPAFERAAPTLKPLSWYESPWLQLAALLLFVVAFAGYPLSGAVRRIRGRRGPSPAGRPARFLAAAGLAAMMGTLGYLFFMMANAANFVGPTVFGRPIPWLVLQVLAVTTVVFAVTTMLSWRRHRHEITRADQVRLGLLLAAGVLFVPWAGYWGLLTP